MPFPNYQLLTGYARGNAELWSAVFRAVMIKAEIPYIYEPPQCKWSLPFLNFTFEFTFLYIRPEPN